jgi:hypothetical protein
MAVRDRALVPCLTVNTTPGWLLALAVDRTRARPGLSPHTMCERPTAGLSFFDRNVTGDSLYVVLLGILQHVSQNFRAGYY